MLYESLTGKNVFQEYVIGSVTVASTKKSEFCTQDINLEAIILCPWLKLIDLSYHQALFCLHFLKCHY